MNLKFLAVAAMGAIAALLTIKASAMDSVLAMSPDPTQICSDFAARATADEAVPKSALRACNEAVDRAKGTRDELAAALINRGGVRLALHDNDGARDDSEAAIRVRSDLPQAYINLGIAFSAENRKKEAGKAFTDALALNPSHPEIVYFDRALTREDDNDMKGAYLDYRKAAQLAPNWDTPKQQLSRFTVGHAPIS